MKNKIMIVVLGIIVVALGGWFYLRSITQKSDINIITTPGNFPISSTRPIYKSPSPTPRIPIKTTTPSPGNLEIYNDPR